jgi:hypothetical protein
LQARFFYPRDVERFLENLDFHGLAAEQALQFAHPSFQLTDTARSDDIFVSLDRLQAAFQHSSTPVEQDTDIPGCIVSSTSRIFSAIGQRRRRWTDVITSTRGGETF